MVAAILALLWQQIPSVCELTKTLNREGVLWMKPAKVSQPALSKRLLAFPAELFQQVFFTLLPKLRERWRARNRPLPESVAYAMTSFEHLYGIDGSTLEALFRKLKALQDSPAGVLAGKICTVIDLATRLPEQIWYTAEALAHDTTFEAKILSMVQTGTLWIFDRGFYDFTFFDDLIERGGDFITRLKSNAVLTVEKVICQTAEIRDRWIILGGENGSCKHTLRLIEVRFGSTWYSYLTSVLDPAILPANIVADLYRRRWRIEEAFQTVKRLLSLSYLWTGSLNGILLQIWVTKLPTNSCYHSTAFRWKWLSANCTTSPRPTIAVKPPTLSNTWRLLKIKTWVWSNGSVKNRCQIQPLPNLLPHSYLLML